MRFQVDIQMMVRILSTYRRSGKALADLPPRALGLREKCQVELAIAAGAAVTCTIRNSQGKTILQGDEGFRKVAQMGDLAWTLFLTETASELVQDIPDVSQAAATKEALPPRRRIVVEPQQLATWPLRYRQVFNLVNGTATAAQIAKLLHIEPSQVEDILRHLRELQIVEWDG